jgi:hypothetical protein
VPLGYSFTDPNEACTNVATDYYQTPGESLIVGDHIYTDYAADPAFNAPDGYYSDGANVYVITGGTGYIDSIEICTVTPTPTSTPTTTPTETPTSTPTETLTSTPTETPTSTPTETLTSTPTETLTSTPTETPTPTPTPFTNGKLSNNNTSGGDITLFGTSFSTTNPGFIYPITSGQSTNYQTVTGWAIGDFVTVGVTGGTNFDFNIYVNSILIYNTGYTSPNAFTYYFTTSGTSSDFLEIEVANFSSPTQTPTPTMTETPTSTPTETPSQTPTLTQTPTSTDLSSITTYTISGCTNLNVLVVDLGPGLIVPGDVNYYTFTGATPSGCYSVIGKINAPIDDAFTASFGYGGCNDCEISNITPTPTNTPSETPTNTPTNTPTETPTNTPTPTVTSVTPTPTPTQTTTPSPTPYQTLDGSLLFNGSTQTLGISPGVTFGAGTFTLEGWFYNTSDFNSRGIVGSPVSSPTGCMNLYFANNTTISSDRNGGGGGFSYTMTTPISLNQWHYFIYNRNAGGLTAVYIDGVRSSTSNDTLDYNTATDTVGRYFGGYWPGYWTNMRMTIGTAVYDSNLTTQSTPRGPLTSLANTKYLMLGAAVTTDSSGTQTVTNNNGVTQTSVKPFTPPANPPF